MSSRFTVSPWHGEARSLFYILDNEKDWGDDGRLACTVDAKYAKIVRDMVEYEKLCDPETHLPSYARGVLAGLREAENEA